MARRHTPRDLASFNYRPLVAAFQRLDRRMQVIVVVVLAVGAIAYFVYHRANPDSQQADVPQPRQQRTEQPAPVVSPIPTSPESHVLLGNPSGATVDVADRDNYLMLKPFHALSYNDSAGGPNWVSWRVTRYDFGNAPRKLSFDFDVGLPPGFKRITHKDYSGSGFDRGHLCPHADRDATQEMAWSTFVMTNIIPQAPNVNQKAWSGLENYTRGLASKQNRRLYVAAGGIGRGGRGSNGLQQRIANGKVTVPAECWKVIVAIPEDLGPDDPSKVDAAARVIAVVMPNDDAAVDHDWARFRTSPVEIERRTGYRFFDKLRPDVAEALRARVDGVHVPPPTPREEHGRDRPD